MNILPKDIGHQIIFVYSNCKTKEEITFEHKSHNDTFDFEVDHEIPYVWFDNPYVYVRRFLKRNTDATDEEEQKELEELKEKFQESAE